jgi:hypothetical protein
VEDRDKEQLWQDVDKPSVNTKSNITFRILTSQYLIIIRPSLRTLARRMCGLHRTRLDKEETDSCHPEGSKA